jgi:hypothetical protein
MQGSMGLCGAVDVRIDGLAVDGKMGRIDATAGRRLWLGGGLQSYDGLVEAVDG